MRSPARPSRLSTGVHRPEVGPIRRDSDPRRAQRLSMPRVAEGEAVREAVGPEIELMVDGHGRLVPGDGGPHGREALAPFKLMFFESHVAGKRPGDAPDRQEVPIPIATGERR